MSLYSIQKCSLTDIDSLVDFLDKYWKKGHSLVLSRELMNFQHYNINDKNYNFFIAINNETKEIDAIIGYIPTSQYDNNLQFKGDYWGAIWKIREDINNQEINSIGLYIWKKIFKLPHFKSYAAIGISEIAKKIYKALRLETGCLNQYYIINHDINNYNIAKNIADKDLNLTNIFNEFTIRELSIDKIKNAPTSSYKPEKSINYFVNRYYNHPVYNYLFWGIFNADELISIWVLRLHNIAGSQILRIIDVLGDIDSIPNINFQIHQQLKKYKVEYIDILNWGISEGVFSNMGFSKLDLDGDVIIPNYFEPFIQKNIKIDFCYKADFNYIIFKGDSDQDRPNNIIQNA